MKEPDTPGKTQAIKELEEKMPEEWKTRKETGQIAEERDITTRKNMMAILSTYREYIEANTDLESEQRPENQGSATVYWRLKQ